MKGLDKSVQESPASDSAAGPSFRFLPVLEPKDIDHLQLKELYSYWCRRRQGARMAARHNIQSRDIARHAPFLSVVELLRSDGLFRVLGAGRKAREFWNLDSLRDGTPNAAQSYKLMRALMRHQAANRLAITLRSTLPGAGSYTAFALLALPLSEDGEEVSTSLIEVISWPLPPEG